MRVLLCAFLLAVAHGFCFSRAGYYIASKALAVGVGDITTHAACKFTNATGISLNSDCPAPCALLVRSTWGDCYCTEPLYEPQAGDAPINHFSVYQIFAFFAQPSTAAVQMQCRNWMQTQSSVTMWKCNSNMTKTKVRIA
jgi:hypothetical protein